MNKASVQNSLMLAPLIGVTGSLMTALGLWLMFVVVIAVYDVGMGPLRARLVPWARLPAGVLLAATLTSCAELAGQAWSLQWQQHLGLYAGLIALQCVVLDNNGFFQSPWRDRLRLCGLFGALMASLGLLRELIGQGTVGAHLSWLTGGVDWPGIVLTADGGLRLATLAPGGFILLGLLIAGWQAWPRPTPSN
ncbi:NADH:quinone oxidoreductase [Pseudomonas sp. ADAK2]|uniref:Rnf-Nqr domain containing protein n=1 Tax=unclassified Pseudomonas TaxID=196821 RepID=UPI00146497C5|nr:MULTISPECIES: Rnf-Nqr domain containing protein [unclassified Pseudomonas]QJI44504.1 NADH:quinone oxidoreductase [Pseudomonas sp. ADAK7]QJI50805.1 NADH:quinone oxidoreductase [Pseudomonas sp. ADAK2]